MGGPYCRRKPADANLEQIAVHWITWKIGTRGVAENTRKNLTGGMNRFFRGLREVVGLRPDEVVPGSALTTSNVSRVAAKWRDRYSEGMVYQTLAAVTDMWTWAGDEPEFAGSIPVPPRRMERIVPPAPVYFAPEAVWG